MIRAVGGPGLNDIGSCSSQVKFCLTGAEPG